MNNLFKLNFLFVLMLMGCSFTSEPVQAERAIHDDGILQFNSKDLYKGDKLSITMPLPHPKELAIKTPNGRWFYLQLENEGGSEKLMSSEKFAVLQKLDLDTQQIMGRYWHDGKAKRGKVFTQSGNYLIYMADNLETERDNTLSFASVIRYTNRKR